MKKLTCELCGSSEFTKNSEGFFVCDFCRTKYTPEQAQKMVVEGSVTVDRSSEATRLIVLAEESLKHQNPSEAYDYASRALEINPESGPAWLCKGRAAGWSSTIQNFRLEEVIGAFFNAEKFTPEESRQALREECALEMNKIASAVYTLSRNHAIEFATVDGVWVQHISRCNSIFELWDESYAWNEEVRTPLDDKIQACTELITGIRYTDYDGTGRVLHLSEAYSVYVQGLIDTAAEKLKKFDPEFSAPKPQAQAAGCFVITATMGNELAYPVVVLRQLRDQILVESPLGRFFVNWYYLNGPKLAAKISPSVALRALSFVFVVLPSTLVAAIALGVKGFRGSQKL